MHNMDQLEANLGATIKPGNLNDTMSEAGASSGDLWKLPYDRLRVIDGFNLRVQNAHYTEN
jgi:hypothetical protein